MRVERTGAGVLTRRAISLRWFGASILAGLAGAGLLGAAIYASSNGAVTFAELPQRAGAGKPVADEAGSNVARKGDKLVRTESVAVSKQAFKAPMTLRVGDREIIKPRAFTKIATALSLTSGVYATDVPPFNPLRFFSDAGNDRVLEAAPETSDADVSVVKSDLAFALSDPVASTASDDDVFNVLTERARARSEADRRAALPVGSGLLVPRVGGAGPGLGPMLLPGGDTSFRSLDIRVVPENVTNFAKAQTRAPDLSFDDLLVPLKRGDTLEAVLLANGAPPDDARAILGAIGRDRASVTADGEQLRLLLAPVARPGAPRQIARATLLNESGIEAIAGINDRGAFVSVAPPNEARSRPDQRVADDDDGDDDGSGITLYESLYETLAKQELPRQMAEDLVRIFGYDVDFQRHVTPGDGLELFLSSDDEAGGDKTEILYAAITTGGEVHRVYRFQSPIDGSVDYFDEQGRSLKKFLIRKPVLEARMSSGFGMRFHPVLGYAKMHTGVDWAAKSGTPILAAGNGTIIKADWASGYGRRTEIQHANGYVTAYNHQSGFARGIAPGAKVRQGQVIGFVGTTGLSTGAHVHYEVIVNGHFVDPLKIRVPRGRELDGKVLAEFNRQRDQDDQLMLKAGSSNRLAQQADLR